MKTLIISPFLNEESVIKDLIESVIKQDKLVSKWILVDDGSTDKSVLIIKEYLKKFSWISLIQLDHKKQKRSIGAKIINAFNKGLETVNIEEFDIIMKIDADLILPTNYVSEVSRQFKNHPKLGLCGGVCGLIENSKIVLERKTNLDHVRGALKAYRRECFIEIEGLVNKMGWDSVDEYKIRYTNWEVKVLPNLMVAHLKETNIKTGHARASFKNGIMLYTIRFDIPLLMTNVLKRLLWKPYIIQGIAIFTGYFYAFFTNEEKIITKDLGKFIRYYRYTKIKEMFFKN
tara:strand:- start:47 stop:910 length:864 start_codon:yes stop_codon:yes gene_type:complete